MDVVKSGVSSVRSNSKVAKNVLLVFIIFMMLPIDSMLRVRVQSQVASPLRQLLSNDLAKIVLAFVFYLIVVSNDVLLLVLYMCALKKLGLY
jgi:hypothetical protein|tara:strand:- start:474 stop:749 length:276 start_codon:yes stop_codon:yes gene_type:complete